MIILEIFYYLIGIAIISYTFRIAVHLAGIHRESKRLEKTVYPTPRDDFEAEHRSEHWVL